MKYRKFADPDYEKSPVDFDNRDEVFSVMIKTQVVTLNE